MMHRTHLSADEAATRLGVTKATLYAYASRGLVQAEPDAEDPRRSLYWAEDIERLVRARLRGRKADDIAGSALDWGAPSLASGITLIRDGRLWYRGRDAAALAGHATLEETARLLWDCGEADPFAGAPAVTAPDGGLAHPVDRCLAALASRGIGTRMIWQRDGRRLWPEAAALLRLMAAAMTGTPADGRPIHRHLAGAWGLDARGADLVRAALVLCADHELNASAFAVRVVASTGASLAACLAGGLAALSGPLHGGTTSLVEILFDEVERSGDAAGVVEERLRRGDRLPGFGHPLYPEGDPRGRALLAMLPADPLRESIALAMADVGRGPANIDFALVALVRHLRLPAGSALTMFALGRAAGWIAHALEQHREGSLIRPRARYVGPEPQAR